MVRNYHEPPPFLNEISIIYHWFILNKNWVIFVKNYHFLTFLVLKMKFNENFKVDEKWFVVQCFITNPVNHLFATWTSENQTFPKLNYFICIVICFISFYFVLEPTNIFEGPPEYVCLSKHPLFHSFRKSWGKDKKFSNLGG